MQYNDSSETLKENSNSDAYHARPLGYDYPSSSARNSPNYGDQEKPSRQSTSSFYKQPADKASRSDYTLNEEYDAAREKAGFTSAGKQTRGSIAAQMAASGEIPRKAGLKMFRADEHHGTFSRGGRYRACGRCCCCTIIVALLVIVGIVAGFLLWVRPPNVIFYGVDSPTTGSEVTLIDSGFSINVNLRIGVTNPNFFGANFKKISATAFYPIDHTQMGGGSLENVDFKANTNNTLHFPLTVNYTSTIDPNGAILSDIATKCGFIGSVAPSNLNVDYTLTLKFKLVAITISPSISSSVSFACPLSESDIQGIIGSSGLGGLLGGGAGNGKRDAVKEPNTEATHDSTSHQNGHYTF